MVHFKVIKGSHLLLTAAILLLALVIGAMIFTSLRSEDLTKTGAPADLVTASHLDNEAKTNTVFASFSDSEAPLEFDPGSRSIDIQVLPSQSPAAAISPSVLIYHTHTHEAYEQVDEDQYVALEAWRTIDPSHSVVRVGQELQQLLEARGFTVVHDTTDHEQNELGTAYTRSLETLEAYDRPFDLYIDVHRDAFIEGMKDDWADKQEEPLAQMMMLIGNGEGFDVKPYYKENLAFAKCLTRRINALKPGLCKDVLVKDGRYNQNIGVFSILLEVGHNRNTLEEALNSLPYFADGLQSLMIDAPEKMLTEMKNLTQNQ